MKRLKRIIKKVMNLYNMQNLYYGDLSKAYI